MTFNLDFFFRLLRSGRDKMNDENEDDDSFPISNEIFFFVVLHFYFQHIRWQTLFKADDMSFSDESFFLIHFAICLTFSIQWTEIKLVLVLGPIGFFARIHRLFDSVSSSFFYFKNNFEMKFSSFLVSCTRIIQTCLYKNTLLVSADGKLFRLLFNKSVQFTILPLE